MLIRNDSKMKTRELASCRPWFVLTMCAIEIAESLSNRIVARIKESNFNSVTDYTSYVLREKLVMKEEASKPAFSKEEEIKTRFRDLGYL